MRRTAAATLLLAVLFAGACSSTNGRNATTAAAPAACFYSADIDSISPIDDRSVYVRVRSDQHYLLTLGGIYPSLPFASGIAISGPSSRVCGDTATLITYENGGMNLTATVVRVEAVESRDDAKKLAAERSAAAKR